VKKPETIVIYPGRFQPFHKGHYYSYQDLVKKFGKNNVYLATSDKTDPDKSPFNFKEKQSIISKMFKIPSSHILKVRSPYLASEYEGIADPSTDILIVGLGEKDGSRLKGKYYKPYTSSEKKPFDTEGYIYIVPQLQMKLDGKTISGSVVRELFRNGTDEERKKLFTTLYGKFDKSMYKTIVTGLGGDVTEVFSVDF
jgi:hypothetical protein